MSDDDRIGAGDLDRIPVQPRYRAIILGPSGNVLGAVRLDATDDSSALSQAKALVDGHAIELWDGMRYIEHFPAED